MFKGGAEPICSGHSLEVFSTQPRLPNNGKESTQRNFFPWVGYDDGFIIAPKFFVTPFLANQLKATLS